MGNIISWLWLNDLRVLHLSWEGCWVIMWMWCLLLSRCSYKGSPWYKYMYCKMFLNIWNMLQAHCRALNRLRVGSSTFEKMYHVFLMIIIRIIDVSASTAPDITFELWLPGWQPAISYWLPEWKLFELLIVIRLISLKTNGLMSPTMKNRNNSDRHVFILNSIFTK